MLAIVVAVLSGVLLTVFVWPRLREYWRNPNGLSLPPGPRPHLLLGNLLDLPTGGSEWLAFERMSKKYGSDLLHFHVPGSHILTINSYKAANDLLDKKSSIYSDRPRLPWAKGLMGWSWSLVIMSYDEGFAAHRRLVQHSFQPNIVTSQHRPVMQREVPRLLRNLLVTPDDFIRHLRSMTGAIIMMVTYGYQVLPKDDPYLILAEDVNKSMETETPGAHIVDFFPFLRYAPSWMFKFKRDAVVGRRLTKEMRNAPFQMVKERLAAGTALPSMVGSLVEKEVVDGVTSNEDLIKNCGAVVYSAGADTSTVTLTNFVLAMIMHPVVQERAQRELDEVVGRDRLPNFNDRSQLPYLACIVKEALRWKAVSPLGIPHYTAADDVYQGMFIPKGTTVFANQAAMLHDPSVYKDPDVFDPDRFAHGVDRSEGILDPARITFGFGRR
ncbi:cytochrome P450 [Artomyces pyxidatus]|uniref:Cytochrome P450 n=1 Tax=Artomyces pyxidatus TaxID=48021 RepID=A0ACB8SRW9_9AGAM|nr:cytochrome P450 [Artomyces pyxidatus]